jgi:hypothetical protein
MHDLVHGNTYAFEQTCTTGLAYDCERTHEVKFWADGHVSRWLKQTKISQTDSVSIIRFSIPVLPNYTVQLHKAKAHVDFRKPAYWVKQEPWWWGKLASATMAYLNHLMWLPLHKYIIQLNLSLGFKILKIYGCRIKHYDYFLCNKQ